ncbi:hypothetical protein QOT17_003138 [Balamuthia mandrillaris]
MLTENRVLSLVVVDQQGKVTSMLSVRDVVAHFLHGFAEEDVENLLKHTYNFYSMLIDKRELVQHTVHHIKRTLKEAQQQEPLLMMPAETATVYGVLKRMLEAGLPRVVLCTADGQPVNIVSQARILQFLTTMLDVLPRSRRTVRELGFCNKPAITIPINTIAYAAFQLMIEKNVNSLAVVGAEGELVATISLSDIKVYTSFFFLASFFLLLTIFLCSLLVYQLLGNDLSEFQSLAQPVISYLLQRQRNYDALQRYNSEALTFFRSVRGEVVTCFPEDSLSTAILALNYYSVHNIYVVSDEGGRNSNRTIGVVSVDDALSALLDINGKDAESTLLNETT